MICETFIVIRNETTPPGSSGNYVMLLNLAV